MKRQPTKRGARKPFDDPRPAMRRVCAWLLRNHPGEKTMISGFRTDVTFAEINRRMHAGEDFSEICSCSESLQREYIFRELARLYGTGYDYWYDLWMAAGRRSRARAVIRLLKGAPGKTP